jgi:hypothetical protein
MEDAVDRTAKRAGEALHDGVRKRTPVANPPPGLTASQFAGSRGRAPGTLKASWRTGKVEKTRSATGVERRSVEEYTEDPIAPHVEWPTRPHVIRPRLDRGAASVLATGRPRRLGNDPMARLRFVTAGGRVVYAAEVHHPGTQGVHMMRDSLAALDVEWREIGVEEMERWAREQLRGL